MEETIMFGSLWFSVAPFGGVRPPCQPERTCPLSDDARRALDQWARRKFGASGRVEIQEWVAADSRERPHRLEISWDEGGSTCSAVIHEPTSKVVAQIVEAEPGQRPHQSDARGRELWSRAGAGVRSLS
jgi:hypothetical protein